jgi:hypothetical protein
MGYILKKLEDSLISYLEYRWKTDLYLELILKNLSPITLLTIILLLILKHLFFGLIEIKFSKQALDLKLNMT